MATGQAGTLVRRIRQLVERQAERGLADRELLRRFAVHRDEVAFAALVRRHGGLVWRVCRNALGHEQDAEDAFQATFLVLARKAGSLREEDALAGWLYGVASRIALKARTASARRRRREREAATMRRNPADTELALRELQAILDEEVGRLPAKYRAPFVLCCLQGKTKPEAARELGWRQGTVSSRLAQARKLLQQRLSRRGVALSAALAAAALSPATSSAAVPALLAQAATRAALAFSAGKTAAGSAQAVALAKGAMQTMLASKLKMAIPALLALGLLAGSAGLAAHHLAGPTASPPAAPEAAAQEAKQPAAEPAPQAGSTATAIRCRKGPWPDWELSGCGPAGACNTSPSRRTASASLPGVSAVCRSGIPPAGVKCGRSSCPACGRMRSSGWTTAAAWLCCNWATRVSTSGTSPMKRPNFRRVSLGRPSVARAPTKTSSATAVSPSHRMASCLPLVAAGYQEKERAVHIWKLATGRAVKDLEPPRLLGIMPANCNNLAFASDGRSLFVFSGDLTFNVIRGERKAKEEDLVVWDVASGEKRQRMKVPLAIQQGHLKAYAVAPNGRSLVLGMWDGTARFWDMTKRQEQRALAVNAPKSAWWTKGVSAVAFSPDAKFLVLGSRDHSVRIWDLTVEREARTLHGHHSWIEAVVVSRDGKRIASAGQDGLIRIWAAATGADACPVHGHRHWLWGVAVSPDGKMAATAASDGTLRTWDLATGRPGRSIDLGGQPGPLTLTPDGRALAVVSNDRLGVWNFATGEAVHLPTTLYDRPCQIFVFGPDCKMLLTAHDGTVSLWEWPAGRLVRTIELPADKAKPGKTVCTRLALSADGRQLVTVSERHRESTIGEFMQSSSGSGVVDLWDLTTGKRIRRLAESTSVFHDAAFTSDGTGLLLASYGYVPIEGRGGTSKTAEEALSLLDLVTGRVRRTFAAPGKPQGGDYRYVRALAYSPDGRTIASAEHDGPVLLFEAATGLLRRRLVGHRAGVSSLVFTPDGKRLVTASFDNTGLVWDVSLTALTSPERQQRAATEPDRAKLWADLAGTEAETINRALASLAAAPADAVPCLRKNLQPVPAVDAKRLAGLIADLDSRQFAVREDAQKELERLGEVAVLACRKALKGHPSAEVRRRVEALLEQRAKEVTEPSPERLRALRAVEVLEHIGTPEAQEALKNVTTGAPEARLTQEAKAALERLARRP